MSKKHFIALADVFRDSRPVDGGSEGQWRVDLYAVAEMCCRMSARFNRQLWLDYVYGKCGPSGGKL